jgi:hypothetical protein
VKASEKGAPKVHRIKLETPRHFIILDEDYTGLTPSKITEKATRFVRLMKPGQ